MPRHQEEGGNEELYVVVRGRATFTVDGSSFDAPAGTLVHVLPGESREAVAEEPGTIVLAVGATPGEAFVAHGWDEVVVAFADARAGRIDEARALMHDVAARHPGEWYTPYNLACFEARFGDAERAFEHLRAALARDERAVREIAERDSDLDALRGDPQWQELLG